LLTKISIRSAAFLLVLATVLAGCKKKQEFNQETAQATVDNRFVMSEMDEVVKEVNTVVMEQFLLRGKVSGGSGATGNPVCGAKTDTTSMLTGEVNINYDGSECFGRVRTGSVKFTINGYPLKKWKQPGTVITIEFRNYKVKRSSDTRVMQLSGTQRLTNLSGNTWFELWYLGQPSVVYNLAGEDMQVTYDESKIAIVNVNRKMTYTFANNITTCRIEGLGSFDGREQLENWGQGRDGLYYSNRVSSPMTWKTSCGAIALTGGESVLKLTEREYEMRCRYGIDEAGNSVSEVCPFGWEVTWQRKSKTNSRKFGYY
jgi:hypothetical protein